MANKNKKYMRVSTLHVNYGQREKHNDYGERYVPPTRHRFLGVNWTFKMGVRFVGNVPKRSTLHSIDEWVSMCT